MCHVLPVALSPCPIVSLPFVSWSLLLSLRDNPVIGMVLHVDKHGHNRIVRGVERASGFGFDITALDGKLQPGLSFCRFAFSIIQLIHE